jgi:site-specific DNA recombinase
MVEMIWTKLPAPHAGIEPVIVSGSVTDVQQIASRQKCSVRQVNMTISLAFLAPDLVRAAVEGRLPRGIGVERLRDAPAEWSQQFEALGLNPR